MKTLLAGLRTRVVRPQKTAELLVVVGATVLGLVIAFPARAQSPGPIAAATSPAFEVASIKPADPSSGGRSLGMPRTGNSLTIKGWSLKDLIRFAYGPGSLGSLQSELVIGGPKWLDDSRYDVIARAEGNASQEQRRQMLGALLVERCHLAFHYESRESFVYALVAGKNGPKMKERKPGDGGEPFTIQDKGIAHLSCRDISMARLAMFLESNVLGRSVSDRTHRNIRFRAELEAG